MQCLLRQCLYLHSDIVIQLESQEGQLFNQRFSLFVPSLVAVILMNCSFLILLACVGPKPECKQEMAAHVWYARQVHNNQ